MKLSRQTLSSRVGGGADALRPVEISLNTYYPTWPQHHRNWINRVPSGSVAKDIIDCGKCEAQARERQGS